MRARHAERGSVLATSAVILAGLIGVAGLSVISVQRSMGVSGQQRGHCKVSCLVSLRAIHVFARSRKTMMEGLPTGVYWPVKVNAPVCRFTRKQATASAR